MLQRFIGAINIVRRQSNSAFRQKLISIEDFVFDLRSRRDDPAFDHATDTFEGFMCELDLFEDFMFMVDLRRLQNETAFRPEFDALDGFRFDLEEFDEFMLVQWTHADTQRLHWENVSLSPSDSPESRSDSDSR
ncbi:hypothetical protein MMC07_004996 [Pseudocyphellaria aurata]|nr:hypothetical protein [Pseudocyphellaria aurata]